MKVMIKLENVSKSYLMGRDKTVYALHDISLTVKHGEFVSIVGPSGSGKSTILAISGLLDRASGGKVWFREQDVTALSDAQRARIRSRQCGFVFQFPSLIPTLTALENVVLPKTISGGYESADDHKGSELLDMVGLKEKGEHLPYQLSGGEQRRVALARALMNNPDVILADEPTGALDQENARLIMNVFSSLNQEGKTIIIVTHDLELAGFAKRTWQIRNGQIV